jgi:hypothetical protein
LARIAETGTGGLPEEPHPISLACSASFIVASGKYTLQSAEKRVLYQGTTLQLAENLFWSGQKYQGTTLQLAENLF